MDSFILNKRIPFSIKTQFGIPLLASLIVLVYFSIYFVPLLVLACFFMFSSYSYEFNKNLKHRVRVKVFDVVIYSFAKSFIVPDYISLFNQPLKTSLVSGFMEIGSAKYKEFSIKFFNGNMHETVYRSKNKDLILSLGKGLSEFFDVDLYNNLK